MRIAVSAKGDTPESSVDPRFGQCDYFVIYDDQTDTFHALRNGAPNQSLSSGDNAALRVITSRAHVVLTGDIEPNALDVLEVDGIEVYIDANGTVKEAIERYDIGDLLLITELSVKPHFASK